MFSAGPQAGYTGASPGQARTNQGQVAGPDRNVGLIALPPVAKDLSRKGLSGDTGHMGGGWLASMRVLFFPKHETVTPQVPADDPDQYVAQPDRTGVEYGAQPWRIANTHRNGMTLNAGVQQFGSQQSNYHAYIPPPLIPATTRGPRSISGILDRVAGADRMHIPAIYVPRQIQ